MERNHSFLKGALCGALAVFVGGSLVLGGMSLGKNTAPKLMQREHAGEKKGNSGGELLNESVEAKIKEIEDCVDSQYLRDVDENEMRDWMYAGMMAGLDDPYARYYNEEETKELFETTTGEYIGIGATMSQNRETGVITISKIHRNSPAEKAGLLEQDILYKVEGEEVTGEDLSMVVGRVKGEEGTPVKLTVLRTENRDEVELTAVRGKVETQTVEFEMKDNQLGYIGVTEFDNVTYAQFKEALDTLEGQQMQGLVVDLRGNLGGNLSTVCEMLNEIVPKGTIVSTKDKSGREEKIESDGRNHFDIPLVVLVNEYSASASEIFAGAVQDYGIGTIVGTTTYGKGVVQQLFPLSDGTYVKLTTSEYFTPDGRNIDGTGIEPDKVVEAVRDEANPEADNQLEAALELLAEGP